MLYKEIITVCSDVIKKQASALCVKIAEFFNFSLLKTCFRISEHTLENTSRNSICLFREKENFTAF
jgi:hypothetical protein